MVESDLTVKKPKSLTNEVVDLINRDVEKRMDQINSEQAAAVAAYDADMQKMRQNENYQLTQNNNAETQTSDHLKNLTAREQNLRNQFNRYKDITLKNYLLQSFSSGDSGIRARLAFLAVPLVFLFSVVFSSGAAVSSAISMAIDAIPTATSTPTATLTPTATSTPTPTSTPTQTSTPTITNTPTNTFTPSVTPTPTITPTPGPTLPAASGAYCIPTNTERTVATVRRVIDGDTIEVVINGKVYKVRYIGIDTPEISPQLEPGGREATTRNVQLVQGKKLTLVKDISDTDQYNRFLRYLLVGDVFVNYQLVSEGFAQVDIFPPDVACSDVFTLAQRNAVKNQVGLWAPEPTTTPTWIPIPTPIPYIGGGSSGGGSVSGSGPTALCRDGTYSYSAHHRGTCSHHGGVAVWYK